MRFCSIASVDSNARDCANARSRGVPHARSRPPRQSRSAAARYERAEPTPRCHPTQARLQAAQGDLINPSLDPMPCFRHAPEAVPVASRAQGRTCALFASPEQATHGHQSTQACSARRQARSDGVSHLPMQCAPLRHRRSPCSLHQLKRQARWPRLPPQRGSQSARHASALLSTRE